ncbi:MAG: hypothetical protein NZM31_11565 [Gemmatales bacterium]|nr:hypothetical protein [Gemmatales bacterium]MDW8387633.1 hypothetical protein [Gemmatales bacterium]
MANPLPPSYGSSRLTDADPRPRHDDVGPEPNGSLSDSAHLRALRLHHDFAHGPEAHPRSPVEPDLAKPDAGSAAVIQELRQENERLKQSLEQARARLEKAEQTIGQMQAREADYERLLEEKTDLIRQLHQELQEAGRRRPEGSTIPNEEELIALHQELEREREQLKQDEEALMAQVREMEIQMSRERADLARQKNELMRLQNELKHQLELASRDAQLRERLGPLFRLQEELQRRRGGGR